MNTPVASTSAPISLGWLRIQYSLLALAGLSAVSGAVIGLNGGQVAPWAAAFLACFGLAKGLVGVEKIVAVRRIVPGGIDPRSEFASHGLFWAFIGFKLATWMVAWIAAGYVLTHPRALAGMTAG
jgi:hypothetical protein